MLSTRAVAFLSTLDRRPFVPTRTVEDIIRNQGDPSHPQWLEFHERFAGYVVRIGRDVAVWGLIHENPLWSCGRLPPMTAEIDREPLQETWYITCADVHPSYTYRLDDQGEFLGRPAKSFDKHVERMAVGWEFSRDRRVEVVGSQELRSQAFLSLFDNTVKPAVVPEASDQYLKYYMDDHHLVVADAETGKLRDAWRQTERNERAPEFRHSR